MEVVEEAAAAGPVAIDNRAAALAEAGADAGKVAEARDVLTILGQVGY